MGEELVEKGADNRGDGIEHWRLADEGEDNEEEEDCLFRQGEAGELGFC